MWFAFRFVPTRVIAASRLLQLLQLKIERLQHSSPVGGDEVILAFHLVGHFLSLCSLKLCRVFHVVVAIDS